MTTLNHCIITLYFLPKAFEFEERSKRGVFSGTSGYCTCSGVGWPNEDADHIIHVSFPDG